MILVVKHRANGEGSIRKRADGRWEARYYDSREPDPKKQRKSIIKKTQREVKDSLKAAIAAMDASMPLISNNITVAEWLALWMIEYKRAELRDGTYENYELQIRININPYIGQKKLKELSGIDIQQMFTKLQNAPENGGRGLSAATVIKVKNILSGALKQAGINKMIGHNPLDETKTPKVKNNDIRVLTKEEQLLFINALPFFNTRYLFSFALATGMRIGEICALDKSDINREQKYININKTAGRRKDKYTGKVSIKVDLPKTKYSIRRIPLLPSVEIMLARQERLVNEMKTKAGTRWDNNSLVFPTNEGKIHDLSGIRSSLHRILKRAGLSHMTVHALRHTYATTALNLGVAAQNIARILGHKDGATSLRFYAHYINAEATTQLEKLEKQNINHLGITADELQRVVFKSAETFEKANISKQIDLAVSKAKNLAPKKSVEMVLSVCEDILSQPIDHLSASEKEILLGVLARYTMLKRKYAKEEKAKKRTMKIEKYQER